MLQIENLNAHYGFAHVLQGVSLQAERGEIFGVFGRNGVGKTTFMKTVAGWLKPSSGLVMLDGLDLTGHAPDAMNRAGFGFVPEDRRIFPGLTVEENLALGLLGSRTKGGKSLSLAFERFPRLAERRKQAGNTLSGGEQQILAMARILVAKPSVALIDEPSEGLAPMIVTEVFAIIREISAAGSIVVLVEQNVHQALAVCDRFIALERGAIVLEGSSKNEPDRSALLKELAV